MRIINRSQSSQERGAAIIGTLVATLVIATLGGAMLMVSASSGKEAATSRELTRSWYLAEAGLSDALARYKAAEDDPLIELPVAGDMGSEDNPIAMGGGSYWVDVEDAGDLVTLTAYGNAGTAERGLQVVMTTPSGGVFANAVFAGNSSGDPNYELTLGGKASQADTITGDIWSGGDVNIWGDASVDGEVRAGGSITGADGTEGVKQPLPDLAAMEYEVNNDVDVLSEFVAGSSYTYDDAGGSAYQLPEENPAHIFRVNPSDRNSDCASTAKHDFFLEDPYEPVRSDSGSDGSNPFPITLSGQAGNPGPDGSGLVYYIDGNLWIHNFKSYSLGFMNDEGEDVNVTFVVKGNIYFSDNIFLQDEENDGVAFIAMNDEDHEDSGNIYFGDPEFGTLEYMAAYMYAENDFYDNNLDSSGSAEVTLVGNMTAGNHVAITRDFGDEHSRLTVEFDDRIKTGALDMPGLPDWEGNSGSEGESKYQVVAWHEVSIN